MMTLNKPTPQLILSASDIGSAVAVRLKEAGYAPLLLESPRPGAIRRLMSFAGAVFEGDSTLAGLRCVRCESPEAAAALAATPGVVPLLVLEDPLPLPLAAAVLIDARMRKRETPPVLLGQAPLVVGIGPGFVAGVHAHRVIESNWGPHLGRVIESGASEAYTGKHQVVAGQGASRYLYAPHGGIFRTGAEMLQPVQVGSIAGHVDGTPLRVAAAGILRGLAYPGLPVGAGAKLVEVDPTGDPENCQGIAQRPAAIAGGVLQALKEAGVVPEAAAVPEAN